MNKSVVILLKKLEILSAVACRLTFLTRKSNIPIHPKHLLKTSEPEYFKYLKKDQVVLDIGCHKCEHSIKFAHLVKRIVAVDYDQDLLDEAKVKIKSLGIKNIKLQKFNAEEKFPFKNGLFDVVIMFDVLEHLYKREQALNEVRRVLSNKGVLVLSVPNSSTSWKKVQKKNGMFYFSDPDHKVEFTKQGIIRLVKKVQFKIDLFKPISYDTWLAPIIDLIGGISLSAYRELNKWKQKKASQNVNESIGFLVIARK